MSVIQLLVMASDQRPRLSDISREVSSDGTTFVPYEVDLASHTGFLPITIGERQTGFEFYFDEIANEQLPPEVTQFGTHQMVARTGSDMTEMLASMLFLRAAARLSGAAYVYPDDGMIIPPGEVESYLSDQIEQVRKFI